MADFHIHSTFSDGKLTIPELIDLYGSLGFGAIAITDHLCESETLAGKAAVWLGHTLTPASFSLYMNILRTETERAWDQYGMVVIPGFELSKNSISNHRSAHILGLGVTDFVNADEDVSLLIDRLHDQGAIAVAAHPVSTRKVEKQTYHLWNRRRELRHKFDAWEVASGPYIFDEVRDSGLPLIASSDLHAPRQMRSWKTVLDCERHPEAILEAIRRQQLSFKFYGEVEFDPARHGTMPDYLGYQHGPDRERHLVVAPAF